MVKQKRQSSKWGPHWPAIGEEFITPIVAAHGLAPTFTDVEDGLIWWEKRLTESTEIMLDVHPNTVALPNHCGFSGGVFIKSRVIPEFLQKIGWNIGSDKWTEAKHAFASLAFINLSWAVRRRFPDKKRYLWDIDVANPQKSFAEFADELRECVFPIFSGLTDDLSVIQFIRNLDSFCGGLRGGPPSRPSDSLKVSILYFRLHDLPHALECLDEYHALETADLHRRYVGVEDRKRLAAEVDLLSLNASNLRDYFLRNRKSN
jgi:hypothetical protein